MTTLTYQKTVNAAYLAGIAGIITMPDVIFGVLLELLHSLLELMHLLFEFCEATLDHLVEHIFGTEGHETQIIVFYLMLSMAFCALYYLWRVLPRAYQKTKENMLSTCLRSKTGLLIYWAEQTFITRIKLIVIFSISLACLVLFGF